MGFLNPENLELLKQLVLAAALGAFIGIERGLSHKTAGMRTYSLVSLGACLFTLVSLTIPDVAFSTSVTTDVSRIAAQIVTGVGFIAAGIILHRGVNIMGRGVTTAAGIWVAAAIGMAVGFKLYTISVFTSILVVIILSIFATFEEKFVEKFTENR